MKHLAKYIIVGTLILICVVYLFSRCTWFTPSEKPVGGAEKGEISVSSGEDKELQKVIDKMTLEEKIGQMLQPEQAYISADEVTKYGVGSVLSGGGSAPSSGNTVIDWAGPLAGRVWLEKSQKEPRLSMELQKW